VSEPAHRQLLARPLDGDACGVRPAGGATLRMVEALDPNVLRRSPAFWALAEQVGSTPLMEVPSDAGAARIFAKCEWFNPGGTVKARTALAMIHDLLRDNPGRAPHELAARTYSGGSMHLPIAGICQAIGLPCTIDSGSFLTPSAIAQVRAQGADLVIHGKEVPFWDIVHASKAAAEAAPGVSFLFQHNHPANLRIHDETTGVELGQQLAATPGGPLKPDAFVAAIGTGGTIVGVGRALRRESNPRVRIFGVTPSESPFGTLADPGHGKPTLAGSGGLGFGRKQPFVEANEALIEGHFTVSYPSALREVLRFSKLTGVRLGTSAAANWLAARALARELGEGAVVATVFPALITPEEWAQIERLEGLYGAELGGDALETRLGRMLAIGDTLSRRGEVAS
jgi:cysteine synthase A